MSLTTQENRALHLYFQLVAEALNSAGYGVKRFFAEIKKAEIDWNENLVKENIWKTLQLAMTEKESTAQLDHNDLDEIFKQMHKVIAEGTTINIEFPSEETLRIDSMMRDKQ